MTELSFLIELFLIPDIPCTVRDLLVDRIREVEKNLAPRPQNMQVSWTAPSGSLPQAPSTLALMSKHGDIPQIAPVVMPAPEPVVQIAQTPATAAAMQSRNDAINAAISGKVDKTTGKPRKW